MVLFQVGREYQQTLAPVHPITHNFRLPLGVALFSQWAQNGLESFYFSPKFSSRPKIRTTNNYNTRECPVYLSACLFL